MKHFVFDLGNVLIELRGVQSFLPYVLKKPSLLRLAFLNQDGPIVKQYETGQIDFEAFTTAFMKQHDIPLSRADFQEGFRRIIGPEQKGAVELLKFCREKGGVAMLSNTNDAHMDYLRSFSSLCDYCDRLFLSYEMGRMKPDRWVYEHVIDTLAARPADIYFFDDRSENVEAAQAAGIQAFQVDGPAKARAVIEEALAIPE